MIIPASQTSKPFQIQIKNSNYIQKYLFKSLLWSFYVMHFPVVAPQIKNLLFYSYYLFIIISLVIVDRIVKYC